MSIITDFSSSATAPLSGWYARPDAENDHGPVIVALHGGGYSSHYWRFASLGGGTLANLGPEQGMTVVAINRPGSGLDDVPVASFEDQAELVIQTVAGLLAGPLAGSAAGSSARRPVVLVGHSIGAALSYLIAAKHDERLNVVGIDVSGIATRFRAGESLATLQAVASSPEPVEVDAEARTGLFFGDASTWDQAVADEDYAAARPAEPLDLAEILTFPETFASIAGRIDVPVNFTLAELDILYETAGDPIELVRDALTATPAFTAAVYEKLGHCVHLHRRGPEIVSRVVDFARELG